MSKPRVKSVHHIKVPPLTNVHELLGNYHNLFQAKGIKSFIPFRATGEFTHPIAESKTALLHDFINTNIILTNLLLNHEKITVDDAVIVGNGLMINFFFSMQEKQDHVLSVNM